MLRPSDMGNFLEYLLKVNVTWQDKVFTEQSCREIHMVISIIELFQIIK
jgi:hypothetical protein